MGGKELIGLGMKIADRWRAAYLIEFGCQKCKDRECLARPRRICDNAEFS